MPRPRLIVSDLDGTLLGDDSALLSFAEWHRNNCRDVALVYASGRTFHSIVSAINSTALPIPDAVITSIGTRILGFPHGEPLMKWPSIDTPRWNAGIVRHTLDGLGNLQLQPEAFQSEYKVSYYLIDAGPEELETIHSSLADRGLSCELIYSSKRDLDVLPLGINKGTAIHELARLWTIDVREIIVCGDTGNDLAMFRAGCCGVVVGNAHEELKQLADETVYHAKGSFAAGVLEGVDYWMNARKHILDS